MSKKLTKRGINMEKQELIENFALNLEKERVKLGLSQRQMAEKLGLHQTTYRNIIEGTQQKIDVCILVKLYELTGKFAFEFLGIDDRKTKIAEKLNYLSDQQLVFIHSIVELERLFKSEHPGDCDDFVSVYIPTKEIKDGMVYDSNHVTKINVAAYRNKFKASIDYAIKITSSHLSPVYIENDVLLISKEPIRDGDIGLFLNKEDGRVYIRKLKRNGNISNLIPINEYGKIFEVDTTNADEVEKWVKFGKILTKMR